MMTQEQALTERQRADLAAVFLAEIAGDKERHIEMRDHGSAKYTDRPGRVTPELALAHLDGRITIGAQLWHGQEMCRAVCFDADTPADWQELERAAHKLRGSGAWPILAPSPSSQHTGGGHLWLAFDALVHSLSALATAERIAPELRSIKERWPSGSRQVRLPGGLYRGLAAKGCSDEAWDDALVDPWCELAAAGTGMEFYTGYLAIEVIMEHQTPSTWVSEQESGAKGAGAPSVRPTLPSMPVSDRPTTLPTAWSDPKWQKRYGHRKHRMWFWVTDEEVARYFNARFDVTDMVETNREGYALATWRGEQTASVKIYPDSNSWADFGRAGRPDGRPDGGDALELYCRIRGITRSKALDVAARMCVREANEELERAAQEGRGPAEWVARIMSPAGWDHYEALRAASMQPSDLSA